MREVNDKLSGKELAEEFSNFVNNFGHDSEGFINGFTRQHRTLQQSMFRLIIKVVERVAEDDYSFDGRNRQSHETAKLLIEGWKKEYVKKLVSSSDFWSEEKALEQVNNQQVKPSGSMNFI